MNLPENKIEHGKETSRIEGFSDGVFAIAITLLILDIHVPEFHEGETLLSTLMHEWASMLALLIGFFTILVCWINHHYMFQVIRKMDSRLLLLNGFKLLIVTITPFSTALLSKHLESGWRDSAISIYAFNFALMGMAMTAIWYYAKAMKYISIPNQEALTSATRLYFFASFLSILIWIFSFINIAACLALFGLMFLIFIFPEKMVALQAKINVGQIVLPLPHAKK